MRYHIDITGMTITIRSIIAIATAVITISNFLGGKTKKVKNDEAYDIIPCRYTYRGISEKIEIASKNGKPELA